jgi:hypothetical protein
MVALAGGTIASAKLWFVALADGIPASSRTDEPSAVIRGSRCSRRTISIDRRLVVDCREHLEKRKAPFPGPFAVAGQDLNLRPPVMSRVDSVHVFRRLSDVTVFRLNATAVGQSGSESAFRRNTDEEGGCLQNACTSVPWLKRA